MNTLVIVLIAAVCLVAAYTLYGRWLAKKWGIDPKAKTPAVIHHDGQDYVPTDGWTVFAHQFSSIAGAGPVTGAIQAAVFGWVPVLLWIILGGIFFGAVTDFGALYASVKKDGKSIDVYKRQRKIFFNTNLSAAVSTVTVMIVTWIRYKKPDVSMTLNGSLAGLVAITAGCDVVEPWAAAVIGVLAGFAVVFGIEFVDQKLKVDDPVGAVGVHCINGALGTLLTGIFISASSLSDMGKGRLEFLGVQCLGCLLYTSRCV